MFIALKMSSTSKVRKFKHVFEQPRTSSNLSPEIQSSLLHIGMRVRRSIALGYRTQTVIEETSVKAEGRATQLQPPTIIQYHGTQLRAVLQVGVLEDEEEGNPSSQDSLTSVSTQESCTPSASDRDLPRRKRGLESDEDFPESVLMHAASTCLRPIAQAKSRSTRRQSVEHIPTQFLRKAVTVDDFEEPDFLVPMDHD